MDVTRMGYRPNNYDNAKRQLALKRRELELKCPNCEERNRPGRLIIELDETDTAWCLSCAYNWAVAPESL